jgi:predicted Zn-dependent protease
LHCVFCLADSKTAQRPRGYRILPARFDLARFAHASAVNPSILVNAVGLEPHNVAARINYGTTLVNLGRWDEAIVQLAPIARAEPKRIVARTNLAIALASRGHVDQAIAELRQILQIAPDYAPHGMHFNKSTHEKRSSQSHGVTQASRLIVGSTRKNCKKVRKSLTFSPEFIKKRRHQV